MEQQKEEVREVRIEGYSDYGIDSLGTVWSYKNGVRKRLRHTIGSHGYPYISTSVKGVVKKFTIHRLVAKAFHENHNNKPMVNHINGIKTDNRAINLEWCNNSENLRHAYRVMKVVPHSVGKFGILHHNSKPIIQMDKNGEFISEYAAIAEAARHIGLSHTSIIKVLSGKGSTCGGFTWKYKEVPIV